MASSSSPTRGVLLRWVTKKKNRLPQVVRQGSILEKSADIILFWPRGQKSLVCRWGGAAAVPDQRKSAAAGQPPAHILLTNQKLNLRYPKQEPVSKNRKINVIISACTPASWCWWTGSTSILPYGGICLTVTFVLSSFLQTAHIKLWTSTNQHLYLFWSQQLQK